MRRLTVKPLESDVQSRIIKQLESEGFYVIKLMLTSKPGIPDLLALKEGVARFIEVKRRGERATPLQNYRIQEMRALGFEAYVWNQPPKSSKQTIFNLNNQQNEKNQDNR